MLMLDEKMTEKKKKGSNEKVHGIYLFINYYFANKHENCIYERIEEKKKLGGRMSKLEALPPKK